ncbi:hypothetical protein HDU96_005793 [Phlyctochytrium bullatum]|nr:hypothetical protein HDU96_005793 [Phlyctochytrium bullatum]
MADSATANSADFNSFDDDDEFEDFGLNEWDATQEDPADADMWFEDWDAEDMSDEFTEQLRYESCSK